MSCLFVFLRCFSSEEWTLLTISIERKVGCGAASIEMSGGMIAVDLLPRSVEMTSFLPLCQFVLEPDPLIM